MSCQSFELFKNVYEHKEIFLAGIAFLKKKKVLFLRVEDIVGEEERHYCLPIVTVLNCKGCLDLLICW